MAKKILLVEDEASLRELYKEILQEDGFLVEDASNGEQALALMKKGGYNLVLLDVVLPKLSGLEVLAALKTQKTKKPNGPVVVLTNLGKEAVDSQKELGIKGYLIKSDLTPDQFIKKVRQFLND